MSIYKYTMKKYAKSYSTWIIVIITAIILFIISGILPFVVWSPDNVNKYSVTILILIPNITVFLSIFTSVFSGFKSATMFKDEVEDGTFLIILSKPISRSKILIYKWLALQTFLFSYSIFSSLFFATTLAIFDVGNKIPDFEKHTGLKTLRENFLIIFGFISIILYIMSLTFSSIAIFLSTKLSVSSTVGISIALGIVIPVTSLVRTFTQKKENLLVTSNNIFEHFYNNRVRQLIKNEKAIKKISDNVKKYKKALNIMPSEEKASPGTNKNLFKNFLNKFDNPEKIKNRLSEHQKNLKSLSENPENIYNLSITSGERDHYKNLWFLDTNFQIKKLTSLVYDRIVPPYIQNSLFSNFRSLRTTSYNATTKLNVFNANNKNEKSIEKFDQLIENSWQKTKKLRADFLTLWLAILFQNRTEIQQNYENLLEKTSYDYKLMTTYSYIMERFDIKYDDEKFNLENLNFYLYFLEMIDIIRNSSQQKNFNEIEKVAVFLPFIQAVLDSWNKIFKIKNPDDYFLFSNLTGYLKYFIMPLDIWIWNKSKLNKLVEDSQKSGNSFEYKNSIITRQGQISRKDEVFFERYNKKGGVPFTKLFSYYLIRPELKGQNLNSKVSRLLYDHNIEHHRLLNNLISRGIKFNQTEKKEYASKYKILIIFLLIAILLIPLAYLFIRKKDFR